MEDNSPDYKVSKYNSGIAQLIRLDALRSRAHTHSISGNFELWNVCLDKIWSELAGDFKEGSDLLKVNQMTFAEFNNKLALTGSLAINNADGFKLPVSDDKTKRNKQYSLLLEKEIWLNRIQNKAGKGTAYDESAEEYMDD